MKQFAKLVFTLIASRKLWATATALVFLRWDYWSDIKCIDGFTDPEQLKTFALIVEKKCDTLKWILLGYLGIEGGVQAMGTSAFSGALRRFSGADRNHNTKGDRE